MAFSSYIRLVIAGLLGTSFLPAEGEKNYRVFVGVDLLVDKDDAKIPVENLRKHDIIVSPANGSSIKMKEVSSFGWARTLKASRAPITITDFEEGRAFSLANDKAMQYMQTQNNMAGYQQERTDYIKAEAGSARIMQGAAIQVQSNIARASSQGMVVDQSSAATQQSFLENSSTDLADANLAMTDRFFTGDSITIDSTILDKATGVAGNNGEDILELTFQIASLVPIADAYVVVMGVVTQKAEEGITIFHQNIGAIGPEPRKVKIRKLGFDPGFTIADVNLHVYTNGKEIATNRSEKNFALTRDQAREFILLSHIAEHPRENVDAQPVWTLAPPALLANKSGESFNYPVVVNIDADGSIISIHDTEGEARTFLAQIHDAADLRTKATPTKQDSFAQSIRVSNEGSSVSIDQTGSVPASVIAAVSDMIFLPALELGTPVAVTTKVNLADFYR